MAISFVRGATGAASSNTSATISFDATGCDFLAVGARDTGTTQLITGVTYNGVALTLARHDGTNGRGSSLFYLVAPAAGVHDVIITYSGGAINLGSIVSGFSGVSQASPIGNVAGRSDASGSGSGTGPTVNVPITLAAGSVALDFFVLTKGGSTVAPTPGGSQTGITTGYLETGGFTYGRMSYLAGATQMSWSWNGASVEAQSHSVIELKAGAASTVSDVTVSPSSPAVAGSATQQFTATVNGTGSPSQAVTWSVTGVGSINSSGLYTAPTTTGSVQNATVTATSTQDGTKAGTAAVTVPAFSGTVTSVTVSPSAPSVTEQTTQQFTATVNGTGSPSQSVTWAANIGSINSSGLWTAPIATGVVQTATITATSVQNTGISGNAAPTVPAAVVPTLSAGFMSVFGQSLNFADRTKDTTTTTGTGTVTLSGTAPTGFQSFSSAFAAGTKRISYLIEDASGAWEAGLGTLATGTTLARDTVLASSNAGALVSFAAGSKSVYCAVTAAAVKRFATKPFIDARDYAVDPTFTTDSTPAIQAIINDCFVSGLPAEFPVGRYKLAGALKSPDDFGRGCNGQLYIPASQHDGNMRHVYLRGVAPPHMQYSALIDEPIINAGVIFESTLTPAQVTGTDPAVFCASYGYNGGFGFFNFTDVTLENICIRTNTINGANSLGGFNGYNMSNMPMFKGTCRIDVNRGLRTNPDPTAKNSTGFIGTPINNSGMSKSEFLFVGGYANGARFSEHMHFDRFTAYGCVNAVILKSAYHGSWIGHLNVEGCKNSIVIDGSHALAVGLYDTEHNTPGTWFDFAYDIKYNSGNRKVSILNSLVVVGGVGISDAGWNTNATSANYKVVAGAGEN